MRSFGRALLIQLGLYLALSAVLGLASSSYPLPYIFPLAFKILVFLPPIIYYSRSNSYRPFSSEEKRNISVSGWIIRYAFGLSATVVLTNLIGLATAFALGESEVFVFSSTEEALWSLVTSVIFTAVLEEVLFRGAFFHASEGQNGAVRIILCAVFFALMHYSLSQFLYALASGIVISAFFAESKSLWLAVLLHASVNFVTWAFAFARMFLDTSALEFVLVVIFAIIAVVGCVIWVTKRKKTPEGSDVDRFVYVGAEGALYACLAVILIIIR